MRSSWLVRRSISSPFMARMNRATCPPTKSRSSGKCSIVCANDMNLERRFCMLRQTKRRASRPRVADEIMAGMRELVQMMDQGKTPEQMFTVKTVEIPDPSVYRAKQIRELRESLSVSQAVFAQLLGVS